jgi:beta-glucanase (GH16 family)
MKQLICISILFTSIQLSFSQNKKVTPTADGKCLENDWKLVFEDDFDGTELNKNTWAVRGYAQGSFDAEGSNEYYSFDNVKVENGICKLIPKKETVIRKAVSWKEDSIKLEDGKINTRTYNYTSGWIETKEQFHYGKYEIRCKIPKGKSCWSAFWMYGQVGDINNEIDVFEFWNPKNAFGNYSSKKLSMQHHMTLHFNHKMSVENYVGPDYSLDYHTFTLVWDSTKIEWFVDGDLKRISTQYQTKRGKNVQCKDIKAGRTYILNPVFPTAPMAIITNIALQSGKNSPDESTFINPAFEIDYIRYYKPVAK